MKTKLVSKINNNVIYDFFFTRKEGFEPPLPVGNLLAFHTKSPIYRALAKIVQFLLATYLFFSKEKAELKAGAFDHSAISASNLRRGLFKKVYINLLENPRKIFDFSGLEKCLFF
jgi:hypothetical protein